MKLIQTYQLSFFLFLFAFQNVASLEIRRRSSTIEKGKAKLEILTIFDCSEKSKLDVSSDKKKCFANGFMDEMVDGFIDCYEAVRDKVKELKDEKDFQQLQLDMKTGTVDAWREMMDACDATILDKVKEYKLYKKYKMMPAHVKDEMKDKLDDFKLKVKMLNAPREEGGQYLKTKADSLFEGKNPYPGEDKLDDAYALFYTEIDETTKRLCIVESNIEIASSVVQSSMKLKESSEEKEAREDLENDRKNGTFIEKIKASATILFQKISENLKSAWSYISIAIACAFGSLDKTIEAALTSFVKLVAMIFGPGLVLLAMRIIRSLYGLYKVGKFIFDAYKVILESERWKLFGKAVAYLTKVLLYLLTGVSFRKYQKSSKLKRLAMKSKANINDTYNKRK